MSTRPPITAVIVTFHPDLDFEHRLGAITREADDVIVVDNTAESSTQERLRAACATHHARFVANGENLGLATALNQAITIAAECGVEWVIAFDQDSTPEPAFAAALLAVASAQPLCAVTGANWHDEARPGVASKNLQPHSAIPFLFHRASATRDLTDVTCVITSGTLFRVSAWRALDGFDAALFIDLVDTDYCLRARRAGFTIAVAAGARLAHRRGAKQPVAFLGRTLWPAFMPPLRLRYLFRNRLSLVGRHGWRNPHWVAFELVYAGRIIAEILFLEDRKFAKLSACFRGTWDGLMGASGRLPSLPR